MTRKNLGNNAPGCLETQLHGGMCLRWRHHSAAASRKAQSSLTPPTAPDSARTIISPPFLPPAAGLAYVTALGSASCVSEAVATARVLALGRRKPQSIPQPRACHEQHLNAAPPASHHRPLHPISLHSTCLFLQSSTLQPTPAGLQASPRTHPQTAPADFSRSAPILYQLRAHSSDFISATSSPTPPRLLTTSQFLNSPTCSSPPPAVLLSASPRSASWASTLLRPVSSRRFAFTCFSEPTNLAV